MPLHYYECDCGETFEKLEHINATGARCPKCRRVAKLGVASTGAPILVEGKGGFHRPTRKEHEPTIAEKFDQVQKEANQR
jgi:predicted nucleic acid-binding Zn ribbon protein